MSPETRRERRHEPAGLRVEPVGAPQQAGDLGGRGESRRRCRWSPPRWCARFRALDASVVVDRRDDSPPRTSPSPSAARMVCPKRNCAPDRRISSQYPKPLLGPDRGGRWPPATCGLSAGKRVDSTTAAIVAPPWRSWWATGSWNGPLPTRSTLPLGNQPLALGEGLGGAGCDHPGQRPARKGNRSVVGSRGDDDLFRFQL